MKPKSKNHPARDRWIAEAAYYRAEKRGFAPGYALEDWLAAESLVDFESARDVANVNDDVRYQRKLDLEK